MNNKKKEPKQTKVEVELAAPVGIASKADLKDYLALLKEKMLDGQAAPIYVLGALNNILTMPNVYDLLDKTNQELAKDLWQRLKATGMQVKNPAVLFGPEEETRAS